MENIKNFGDLTVGDYLFGVCPNNELRIEKIVSLYIAKSIIVFNTKRCYKEEHPECDYIDYVEMPKDVSKCEKRVVEFLGDKEIFFTSKEEAKKELEDRIIPTSKMMSNIGDGLNTLKILKYY